MSVLNNLIDMCADETREFGDGWDKKDKDGKTESILDV